MLCKFVSKYEGIWFLVMLTEEFVIKLLFLVSFLWQIRMKMVSSNCVQLNLEVSDCRNWQIALLSICLFMCVGVAHPAKLVAEWWSTDPHTDPVTGGSGQAPGPPQSPATERTDRALQHSAASNDTHFWQVTHTHSGHKRRIMTHKLNESLSHTQNDSLDSFSDRLTLTDSLIFFNTCREPSDCSIYRTNPHTLWHLSPVWRL